jgi:hypothetical protein
MYSEEMRGIHSFYSQRKLLKIVLSEGTPEETQQRILKELAIQ